MMYLRINGTLDELLAFLDERGLAFSSAATSWYEYAKTSARLAGEHVGHPAHILEIGSGAGEVAYFSHEMRPWARRVVVDLPPMLANLHENLSAKIPDASFTLNEWPDPVDGPQIVMLDPSHIDLIPADSVDMGVNFNSFMEMDETVRDSYIAHIYRTVKPGGVFYNVNRRQPEMSRLDGTTFDNHPLLYPYRPDDRVIEWDLDYSQMDPRTPAYHIFRRMAVCRAAIVRPPAS